MAKVTLNQLLELLRGGIGGLVFRKMPDGTIILSGAPRPNKRTASAFGRWPIGLVGWLTNILSMPHWL